MPTYEYACSSCGYEMETFQSMKDDPLRKCPKCKKLKLSRKIGLGAGIIFKGSGFYETDFKTKTGKKENDSGTPSGDAGKESKAAEKKPTEKKPAAETAKKSDG